MLVSKINNTYRNNFQSFKAKEAYYKEAQKWNEYIDIFTPKEQEEKLNKNTTLTGKQVKKNVSWKREEIAKCYKLLAEGKVDEAVSEFGDVPAFIFANEINNGELSKNPKLLYEIFFTQSALNSNSQGCNWALSSAVWTLAKSHEYEKANNLYRFIDKNFKGYYNEEENKIRCFSKNELATAVIEIMVEFDEQKKARDLFPELEKTIQWADMCHLFRESKIAEILKKYPTLAKIIENEYLN